MVDGEDITATLTHKMWEWSANTHCQNFKVGLNKLSVILNSLTANNRNTLSFEMVLEF